MLPAWTTGGKNNQRSGEINPLGFCVVAEVMSESPDAIKAHFSPLPLHKVSEDFSMSEDRPQYLTDALEMIGNQPATVIEPPRQIFERKPSGEFEEVSSPAWIKFSTAFKPELKKIDGNALKIWVFIALSVNYKGEAFPAIQTIAWAVDLSHTTVIAHLRELEKLGLLAVRRGEKRHNIYEISDDYVKVGRGEPVKNLESSFHTIPENDPTSKVLPPNESSPLESNKKNKKNQKLPKGSDLGFALAAGMSSEEIAEQNAEMQTEKDLLGYYEEVMGYNPLDWWTDPALDRLRKFLLTKTKEDIKRFAEWSKRPFSTFDPVKAKRFPNDVIAFWNLDGTGQTKSNFESEYL